MYIMVVTHALSLNINRRTADGIRSDGGRNPIGRRTQSDRAADGIQSDGGRNPIGRRTEHDDKTQQTEQKKVAEVSGLRSTKSNTNCISALLVAAEARDLRYFCWSHFYVLRRPETSATNILLKNIFKREVREYRCRLTQHTDELLC